MSADKDSTVVQYSYVVILPRGQVKHGYYPCAVNGMRIVDLYGYSLFCRENCQLTFGHNDIRAYLQAVCSERQAGAV